MAQNKLQRVLPHFRFSVLPKGEEDFLFLGYVDDQHVRPVNGFYCYWPARAEQPFDDSMLLKVRAVHEREIECWETEAIPYIETQK